jgi:Flp pilus assembly protein TadG
MAQVARRNRWRSETGAELVEFALLLPILLFVIGGIIDFARLFHSYEVVTNAAREGSRLASLPGYEINNYQTVRNRVQQYLWHTNAVGTVVTVVTPTPVPITVVDDIPLGSGVRVTVTYTHDFYFIGPIFALFGGSFRDAVTYQVSSVTRTELQVPLPAPGGTP